MDTEDTSVAADTAAGAAAASADSGACEPAPLADTGLNGAPTSSSDAVSAESADSGGHTEAAGDEMDIDESPLAAVDGSYIGDNCISTPLPTESNSPQGAEQLDSATKGEEATSMEEEEEEEEEERAEAGDGEARGEEAGEGEAEREGGDNEAATVDADADADGEAELEESPDQSSSSAVATDSAGHECTGAPVTHDEESSTMEEEMGGGEGVASSDDVNDISSAHDANITNTGISSSTAEGGADISSSGQAEGAPGGLISSTANGPAEPADPLQLPDRSHAQLNECGDADTSEMEDAASAGESTPLLIAANGATLISANMLNEGTRGGVSSSEAGQEGAVSSSVSNGAPLPPADAAHALATLASAALTHHEQTEPEETRPQSEEDVWYTVGIVTGTTFTVQNYISEANLDLSSLALDNVPNVSGLPTAPLEPGTAYKFRVAGVNSCGRGDFSEESAFKTCLPGFPGAPSAIKISKSVEGAHLSWEPPQVAAEGIFEYSVYLAVRSNTQPKEAPKSQLAFVRVYCGKLNTCVVAQSSLAAAHVDSSTKPAIIFRIAARNDKGYGPATQVRWLQDIKAAGVKRTGDGRLPGASPSKQPKQMLH